MTLHTPTRTAFGQILGHPTRPNIRFMFPPPDGDGAAGAGSSSDGSDDSSGGDEGDGLGDKGKQALDRMKAERNDARQEVAAWKALGLTPEQVKELQSKNGGQDDRQGPDEDAIRRQAREDADRAAEERFAVQARKTAVREQARALGFHNAADALTEIKPDDLAKVAVTDDEADTDAITALVKAVADRKPYLVKGRDSSHGDAGIGSAGSSNRPEPRTPAERMARAYATSGTN